MFKKQHGLKGIPKISNILILLIKGNYITNLKMIGLYLYTLIIGHKSCNIKIVKGIANFCDK